MKSLFQLALILISLVGGLTVHAADYGTVSTTPQAQVSDPSAQGANESGSPDQLFQYVLNLGSYLGYDLTKNPADPNAKPPLPPVTSTLLDVATTQLVESYFFTSFLSSVPINSIVAQFLPTDIPNSDFTNQFANKIFKDPAYNNPSPTTIAVSDLLDQKPYQTDPVNQTLFNILGASDPSFCSFSGKKEELDKCSNTYLYQYKLLSNLVGTLPPYASLEDAFFSSKFNQNVLSQVNSNSLLGPLVYATQGTGAGAAPQGNGVTAPTQAAQADSFIRYASGLMLQSNLPTYKAYSELYDKAVKNSDIGAQSQLNYYFSNLRSYAARASIGVGNLYYILNKRIQQKQADNTMTSQALSEFRMATRRINPDPSDKNPWIKQIDQASPATVQKEIAILLAEINYQMYLSRQQDERMLLTNSMILLNSLKRPPFSS